MQKLPTMRQAFIKLHVSVLLAGLTGLFGKLVHLHQLPMVWYRVTFALVVLIIIMGAKRQFERISLKGMLMTGGVGALLALHWAFFFASIKASNISVGVVCYSLVGFFTSILEPPILHTRYSARDILLSMVPVIGIALIFNFDTHYRYGITLGVVSSLLASLFTIYNKRVVDNTGYRPTTMLLYELAAGAAVMTFVVGMAVANDPSMVITPSVSDFLWLVILASLCTVGLQLLQIEALKRLSAYTVNLTYNLEPVYSIIIAMTVFHEAKQLSAAFFAGLTMIIASVAVKTWLIIRQRRHSRHPVTRPARRNTPNLRS